MQSKSKVKKGNKQVWVIYYENETNMNEYKNGKDMS